MSETEHVKIFRLDVKYRGRQRVCPLHPNDQALKVIMSIINECQTKIEDMNNHDTLQRGIKRTLHTENQRNLEKT